MKLHYYPETDSLYIELKTTKSTATKEISEGILIDFDKRGNIVGLDIDRASKKIDLKYLETVSLPTRRVKVA